MRHLLSTYTFPLVMVTLFSACANEAKDAGAGHTLPTVGIAGHVQTEYGLMLADANVCLVQQGLCTTTDATGYYELPYTADMGSTVVVETSAQGFARRSNRLQSALALQGPLVLRLVDKIAHVTLPSSTDANLTLAVVRDDAVSTLEIAPNVLVDGTGVQAAGDANISFSFWHPMQPLVTAPGNLFAQDGNADLSGLETFGMANIEIEQNGQLLQIATGQSVGWSVQEPNAVALALSANQTVQAPVPDLYWLN